MALSCEFYRIGGAAALILELPGRRLAIGADIPGLPCLFYSF